MSSAKRRFQDRDVSQVNNGTIDVQAANFSEVFNPRIAHLAAKVRKICDGLSASKSSAKKEKTSDEHIQQLAAKVRKFCEDFSTSQTAHSASKSSGVRSLKKTQDQQLQRPLKMRTARKELFKVPAKKTRTSTGTTGSNNKVTTPKLSSAQDKTITPTNKGKFVFNTPKSPAYKFTSQLSSIQEVSNISSPTNCDTTPTSHDTNDSFVYLEKLCSNSPISEDSPTTGVCELLQNNLQICSAKKEPNLSILDQIQKILDKDRLVYEQFEEACKRYKCEHEDNLRKIEELIKRNNTVTDNILTEKNNIKRRSLRLSAKSPIINGSKKKVMSPVILKSGDLRKSALTKSLVTKYEKYQLDGSPRLRNAERMYNETKKYCSVLTTPRNAPIVGVVTPRHLMKNDLSKTIHDQFMLMQDTPKHH